MSPTKKDLENLQKWLSGGRLWPDGLALFKALVTDSARKTVLLGMFVNSGPTAYNKAKLTEELQKFALAEVPGPDRPANRRPTEGRPTDRRPTEGRPTVSPETLKLIREQSHLHSQLMLIKTDAARQKAAFRILEIAEQLAGGPDYPNPEGRPPEAALPDDPVQLIQLRNNNRSYISKHKDNRRKQAEVLRRMEENKAIETKLDGKET